MNFRVVTLQSSPKESLMFHLSHLIPSHLAHLYTLKGLHCLYLRWLNCGCSKNNLNLHTSCWNNNLLSEGLYKYTFQVSYLLPTVSALGAGAVSGPQMFSLNQWCHLSPSLLRCFPFIFLEVLMFFFQRKQAGANRIPLFHFTQPFNHMESIFVSVLSLLCWWKYHWKKPQTLWELCTVGNRERERMTDEKWALQGARCPTSEPLLFTGSLLVPVRELSASELIWAALLSLLWVGRPSPSTAQCTHSLSPTLIHFIHLRSVQFIICPNVCNLFCAI